MSLTDYSRHCTEFLFSLNITLTGKLAEEQCPSRFLTFASYKEASIGHEINRFLHLHPHSRIGSETAFLLLSLVGALGFFTLFRLLSWSSIAQQFLRIFAGIASLTALPVVWIFISQSQPTPAGLPNPSIFILLLELFAAIAFSVLYYLDKWPVPIWWGVVGLILHFGFWSWLLLGGPYFWRDGFKLVFPIVAFCSMLSWIFYVRHGVPSSLSPRDPGL